MDAVKFLEEGKRMCEYYNSCEECPANICGEFDDCRLYTLIGNDAADVVAIVEKWSKEHPEKTRQDVFLEQWPNAKVFVDGVLDFCPQELDSHHPCQSTDVEMRCQSCRRKFWMQEVE